MLMNCLFGDEQQKTRRRLPYIEIRGPEGANLQPIRSLILNAVGS